MEETMTRPYMTGSEQDSRQPANLDLRYGKIGISAVAEALHCTGDLALSPVSKAPADAPVQNTTGGMNSRL
jgi:hypothetical protein